MGEHSYLALPRGGVTPKHVQICPIECVPSRVHLGAAAKAEMVRFRDSVEKMFQKSGAVSLRFERALRTKGSRDHMQAHMVPLSLSAAQLGKSFGIFLECKKFGIMIFRNPHFSESSFSDVLKCLAS